MRIGLLAGAAWAAAAAPAAACLPPPPGITETELIRPDVERSTDIVYGVVTQGARQGRPAQFKVLHVYKGRLKPGAFIRAVPSLGFSPPLCLGTTIPARPPRAFKGERGVIAFDAARPALNFVNPHHLKLMVEAGWIASAQAPPDASPAKPGPAPKPVFVPPPAPPPLPRPGTEVFERMRADYERSLREACLSEPGIRILVEDWSLHQRDEAELARHRAIQQEKAEAAFADPLDLARLERAIAVDDQYQAEAARRRSARNLALLRRLSPADRVRYARRLTFMQPAIPEPRCPAEPPR